MEATIHACSFSEMEAKGSVKRRNVFLWQARGDGARERERERGGVGMASERRKEKKWK